MRNGGITDGGVSKFVFLENGENLHVSGHKVFSLIQY